MSGIDGTAVLDAAVAIDALEVGSDGSALDMEAERTAIKRMVECLNVQRVCYAAFDEVAAFMVVHAMRVEASLHRLPWFAVSVAAVADGAVIRIPHSAGLVRVVGPTGAPMLVPGVPSEVEEAGCGVASALGFRWVRKHTTQAADLFMLFRE